MIAKYVQTYTCICTKIFIYNFYLLFENIKKKTCKILIDIQAL